VFLRGGENERLVALKTGCVCRCLDVVDNAALERQLRRIHQLIAAGESVVPESEFQPGVRVRVKSGPLAGLEGSVFSRRGESRLLVYVDFVQQGASIELGEWDLERID
jgi:transcriptional antiterminator RfaH